MKVIKNISIKYALYYKIYNNKCNIKLISKNLNYCFSVKSKFSFCNYEFKNKHKSTKHKVNNSDDIDNFEGFDDNEPDIQFNNFSLDSLLKKSNNLSIDNKVNNNEYSDDDINNTKELSHNIDNKIINKLDQTFSKDSIDHLLEYNNSDILDQIFSYKLNIYFKVYKSKLLYNILQNNKEVNINAENKKKILDKYNDIFTSLSFIEDFLSDFKAEDLTKTTTRSHTIIDRIEKIINLNDDIIFLIKDWKIRYDIMNRYSNANKLLLDSNNKNNLSDYNSTNNEDKKKKYNKNYESTFSSANQEIDLNEFLKLVNQLSYNLEIVRNENDFNKDIEEKYFIILNFFHNDILKMPLNFNIAYNYIYFITVGFNKSLLQKELNLQFNIVACSNIIKNYINQNYSNFDTKELLEYYTIYGYINVLPQFWFSNININTNTISFFSLNLYVHRIIKFKNKHNTNCIFNLISSAYFQGCLARDLYYKINAIKLISYVYSQNFTNVNYYYYNRIIVSISNELEKNIVYYIKNLENIEEYISMVKSNLNLENSLKYQNNTNNIDKSLADNNADSEIFDDNSLKLDDDYIDEFYIFKDNGSITSLDKSYSNKSFESYLNNDEENEYITKNIIKLVSLNKTLQYLINVITINFSTMLNSSVIPYDCNSKTNLTYQNGLKLLKKCENFINNRLFYSINNENKNKTNFSDYAIENGVLFKLHYIQHISLIISKNKLPTTIQNLSIYLKHFSFKNTDNINDNAKLTTNNIMFKNFFSILKMCKTFDMFNYEEDVEDLQLSNRNSYNNYDNNTFKKSLELDNQFHDDSESFLELLDTECLYNDIQNKDLLKEESNNDIISYNSEKDFKKTKEECLEMLVNTLLLASNILYVNIHFVQSIYSNSYLVNTILKEKNQTKQIITLFNDYINNFFSNISLYILGTPYKALSIVSCLLLFVNSFNLDKNKLLFEEIKSKYKVNLGENYFRTYGNFEYCINLLNSLVLNVESYDSITYKSKLISIYNTSYSKYLPIEYDAYISKHFIDECYDFIHSKEIIYYSIDLITNKVFNTCILSVYTNKQINNILNEKTYSNSKNFEFNYDSNEINYKINIIKKIYFEKYFNQNLFFNKLIKYYNSRKNIVYFKDCNFLEYALINCIDIKLLTSKTLLEISNIYYFFVCRCFYFKKMKKYAQDTNKNVKIIDDNIINNLKNSIENLCYGLYLFDSSKLLDSKNFNINYIGLINMTYYLIDKNLINTFLLIAFIDKTHKLFSIIYVDIKRLNKRTELNDFDFESLFEEKYENKAYHKDKDNKDKEDVFAKALKIDNFYINMIGLEWNRLDLDTIVQNYEEIIYILNKSKPLIASNNYIKEHDISITIDKIEKSLKLLDYIKYILEKKIDINQLI